MKMNFSWVDEFLEWQIGFAIFEGHTVRKVGFTVLEGHAVHAGDEEFLLPPKCSFEVSLIDLKAFIARP